MTKSHPLFQTLLASNALTFKPPLGFFRGFVLDKGGNNEKGMDMKKRGVVPVIDLVRVFALAEGVRKVNTWDRLTQLETIEGGVLSSSMIEDLRDAFELISMIRLRHQASQIEKGQAPDNYVPPEDLSVLERRHLKDAFEVISNTQGIMSTHYKADRFR
jgi:CBS domain-containing protein